tara:strand:+ start:174 stop:644 length:471 start_codon:yes stop_codon:yes gene_type:complete
MKIRVEFEKHMSECSSLVMANAMMLTQNEDDAADLVQDTWLKAWKYYYRFDGDNFIGWVLTICKRLFIDNYRKASRRPDISILEDFNHPLYEVDHGFSDEVRRALSQLSNRDRVAFMLVFIHGYSYKEAAIIIDIQENTFKGLIHRTRNKLKAELA